MAEPLRILLLGSLPPPVGGTTVLFRQLAHELSTCAGARVECIDTQARPGRSALALAIELFARTLRALSRCDVVGLHASPPGLLMFGPLLKMLCAVRRRPLVVRVFGGALDLELDAMSPPKRWLLQFAIAADRLLLETEQVRVEIAKRLPALSVVGYPNSRPLPAGSVAPGPEASARFVFVGHVRPSKGVRELLAASDRVHQAGGRVELAGPLQAGITEADFQAHPGARWLGPVEPAEVDALLKDAAALVLPTWHEGEGHPGVVLEAFTAGCPVVATDWRAIPELVEHDTNGVLVPPRDAAALADALVALLQDPERQRRLARGAAASAARFDSRVSTDRYLEICRELVASR